MPLKAKNQPEPRNPPQPELFSALFGALLGLALLKFGNPIIMERMIDWPTNSWEWVLNPWPAVIGYWLLGGVAVAGLLVARWKKGLPNILVAMPLIWLVWEVISATQSESVRISLPTVIHFCTCVACFYLGLFCLTDAKQFWPFWAGIFVGIFVVVCSGFQQHFGGLEESRKYWFLYVYPTLKEVPPEFLKKMETNRIFATLFYPNTLAGVILMLLPPVIAVLWTLRERFTLGARRLLIGLATASMLACLFWSGSRGGWLLMLVVGLGGVIFLPFKKQTKIFIVAGVLVIGLAGFAVKNRGYFKKGATSVNARFDYWHAAIATAEVKPVFGNGPGTFGKAYERIKRPESEMAQIAHNDYLQQASDSGLPGFLFYAVFVIGTLAYAWRKAQLRDNWIKLAVLLGLFGWALQSLMEFGLYIPAIAWLAFGLMGWLLGQCAVAPSANAKFLKQG